MFSDPRDRTLQSVSSGSSWSGGRFPSLYLDGLALRDLLFRAFRHVDARIESVSDLKRECTRYLFGRRLLPARSVTLPNDPEQFAEAIVAKVQKLAEAFVKHHDRNPLLIETWYGLFQWGRTLQHELHRRVRSGEWRELPSPLSIHVDDALYELEYVASDVNFSDAIVDAFLIRKMGEGDVVGLSDFLGTRVGKSIERYCASLARMTPASRQLASVKLLECLRAYPGDPLGSEIVRAVAPDLWRRDELAPSRSVTVSELARSLEARKDVSARPDSPHWELHLGYVLGHLEDVVPKSFTELLKARHQGAVVASVGAYSADDEAFSLAVAADFARQQALELLRFGAGKSISSLADVPLPFRLMFDAGGLPPFVGVGVEDLRQEFFAKVAHASGSFALWKRLAIQLEGADESKIVTFLTAKVGVKNDLLHTIVKSPTPWEDFVDVGQELISYFSVSTFHSLLDLAFERGDGFGELRLIVEGCRECDNRTQPLPLTKDDIENAIEIDDVIAIMNANLADKGRRYP